MIVDPGSVLLAGMLATVGGSAVLAWLPTGRGLRDIPGVLGDRIAPDETAAFAAGVMVQVAFGIIGAFCYVALWHAAAIESGPAVGAIFGAAHWTVTELLVGGLAPLLGLTGRRAFRPDREALPLLLSYVVYGTLLGLAYSPGS
ncbi:MAG TPA: hypothetical protein VFM93_02580 [Candidatus Limnocylindria bacterium]|nr:hypothetical protein [Candidatus Limnocylindria bacterium]